MNALIQSKNANGEPESQGKQSCVTFVEIKVEQSKLWDIDGVSMTHTPCVEVNGHFEETKGTGKRGGTPKEMSRNVRVQLDKRDLAKIFEFAIKHELLCVPGIGELRDAIDAFFTLNCSRRIDE